MILKRAIVCLASVVIVSVVCPRRAAAGPITIDAAGDAFAVTLTGLSQPGNLAVSLEEYWVATAFGPTSATFEVSLNNTTAAQSGLLTSFGFATEPHVLGASSTSALYPHVFTTGGADGADVCVENDQNSNCFGNSGHVGLQPGDPLHIFLLTLTFADTAGGIVFSNFVARLQDIGPEGDSAKISGSGQCVLGCGGALDTPLDSPSVPEPGTALLVCTAAAGLFIRRRLRRSSRHAEPSLTARR
jgi:hypothetical protein